MLDAYFEAFARYLRTGSPAALAQFCDDDAELACLAVYRNGFVKACTDVLRSSYPSVAQLVGETCFDALAHRHVESHPPQAASLVEYGAGFPVFLESLLDVHGLDYLACVARLDRAWTEVYFAEEAQAPGVQALSELADDGDSILALRCRLAPHVRLVSLDHPVLDAWARLRHGALREAVEIRRAPAEVLIWRAGEDVAFRALTAPEHAFVAAVAAGRSCGEAAAAATDTDAAFDLTSAFASLLHDGMLLFEH